MKWVHTSYYPPTHYLVDDTDKIVGEVQELYSNTYAAYITHNTHIGRYISLEAAKAAVEKRCMTES